MSFSVYSSIGSSFGKLFKSKPKPIFIANTVSTVSIPFLHGFKSGSTSLKALEDGVIEEITEDVFETKYTLSLVQRGVVYSVQISETKDGWILKEVRKISGSSSTKPTGTPGGKKKTMTLSFFVLILISVAGYAYEFGFKQESDGEPASSNRSVFETFSPSNSTNIEEPAEEVKAPDPLETAKAQWEKERGQLEQKIANLQNENEALRKLLNEGITLVVQPGAEPADVAQTAQLAGIVKSAEEFNQALFAAQAGEHIVPGTYRLLPGSSYEEIIETITKGIVK